MDRKHICLIVPPSAFLLDERVFVSLGILKVAAVLENAGHKVDVLDLSGVKDIETVVKSYVGLNNCFVFGITATTPQMPIIGRIVSAIRESKVRAKIILGGPHVTLTNAAYKKERQMGIEGRAVKAMGSLNEMFDVVIAGDGEEAILKAIEPNISGVIDFDNQKSLLTGSKLNNLPFPARHFVDLESYHYFIDGERATNLITQLGCPYDCGFCGGRKSPSFRRIRTRSAENIISEIKFIYKTYGTKGFMFYDDELNISPKVFVQLMNSISKLQEELGVEFKLRGFVRANLFTDEQAKAMYRAGFRWILAGFESGSQKMLNNMNKKTTIDQNTTCIEIARNNGLKIKALMSLGHPGESEKTVAETHDWLLKVGADDFDVTIITVYPGTAYYDDAVLHSKNPDIWVYKFNGDCLYSYDVNFLEVADYYKGNPDGGYKSYVYTDYLNPQEIVKARDYLERDTRSKLEIAFNPFNAAKYEHSMGQILPPHILKQGA